MHSQEDLSRPPLFFWHHFKAVSLPNLVPVKSVGGFMQDIISHPTNKVNGWLNRNNDLRKLVASL